MLKKAAKDDSFLAKLADDSVKALKGYGLTWKEAAAISSGDFRWIEVHIGKLDKRLRKWLDCRLQQENW